MNRGEKYNGIVYRGLTNVDNQTIKKWMDKNDIELRNDQSATKNENIGKEFSGGSYKGGTALWVIEQKSGVDLKETTNVTQGGKWTPESEVVIRKGREYKIKDWDYIIDKTGKPLDYAWYYEGTEYSKENMPPADQLPHHTTESGYYIFYLEER